jgi:hypothetical protein
MVDQKAMTDYSRVGAGRINPRADSGGLGLPRCSIPIPRSISRAAAVWGGAIVVLQKESGDDPCMAQEPFSFLKARH